MDSFKNTELELPILHHRKNRGWGFENPKILHVNIFFVISNPDLDWLYLWNCQSCNNYLYDFPLKTDQYLTVGHLDWAGARWQNGMQINFENLFQGRDERTRKLFENMFAENTNIKSFDIENKNRTRTKSILNTENENRTRTKKYVCSFIPVQENEQRWPIPTIISKATFQSGHF